jgi:thymidylate kinase
VVLCGADGCGKSTAAQALMELLAPTFSLAKSAHYHWKAPVFPAARRSARAEAKHPHAQITRSPVLSLAYFGFHCLEFLLGSWLRVPSVTFKGGLVVIDRFYYDFFVDQKRYRLAVPRLLVSMGYLFIKKPDLVFLLDAPAVVLQSRKQEVPAAETERQRLAYLELVKELPNGIVVNAARAPERVANELAQSILEFMANR